MNGDIADWGDTPLDHPAVATQELTCPSVPVQIQGELTDGRWFYFRCRFGVAELGFGHDLESAVMDTFGRKGIQVGGPWHGWLTVAQINDLFARLYADSTAKEHPE